MEIVMARSYTQSVWTRAKSFFVNYLFPQFSVFLSGITFSLNYRMKDCRKTDELNGHGDYHKWLEIKLLDVDILTIESIKSSTDFYYLHFAFFGMSFVKRVLSKFPFSHGSVVHQDSSVPINFDKRMLTIFLSAGFIVLMGMYFSDVLPLGVHTLLPILLTPAGSLTILQLIVCYRVFATLVHTMHGFTNFIMPHEDIMNDKPKKWRIYLQPFIHPMIFLITVPFLLTATYPVVVTLSAIELSSIIDCWSCFRNMVSFSWNVFCMHVSIMGHELRQEVPDSEGVRRRDFHVFNIDTRIVGGKFLPSSWAFTRLGISELEYLHPYSSGSPIASY